MSPQHKNLKVILIGDSCIDRYHYGTVDRLSPEAPVPIFVPRRIDIKNGMASNVHENLTALGVDVIPFTGSPSTKTRLIDERTYQHILRIDEDIKSEPLLFDTVKQFLADVDGIVVSDYGKGYVTYELLEQLITTNIPILVDTKKTNLARLNGAIVKINAVEFSAAMTLPKDLIVTLGKNGAKWNDLEFDAPKIEITDVCGAGDTFLASFSYKYLLTRNISESIKFAIRAASITVQHIGVYAPTLTEILCD